MISAETAVQLSKSSDVHWKRILRSVLIFSLGVLMARVRPFSFISFNNLPELTYAEPLDSVIFSELKISVPIPTARRTSRFSKVLTRDFIRMILVKTSSIAHLYWNSSPLYISHSEGVCAQLLNSVFSFCIQSSASAC